MELTEEQKEGLRLSIEIVSGPNISVAGGDFAVRKYLAAIDMLRLVNSLVNSEVKPVEKHE